MELICSGDGDIPIFLNTASGNQVDSKSFGEIAVKFREQIKVDILMVADCALYTEENIKLMSNIKWLSRVPLTINEAKILIATLPESEFVQSQIIGYSSVEQKVTYAGINQRWLVVKSHFRRKSDLQKKGRSTFAQRLRRRRQRAEGKLPKNPLGVGLKPTKIIKMYFEESATRNTAS